MANKTRNVASQLVLQQCFKTNCTFLLPVLPHLEPNLFAAYMYIWDILTRTLFHIKFSISFQNKHPFKTRPRYNVDKVMCTTTVQFKIKKISGSEGKKILACSRLPDSGEKSFSKKKCEKRAETGERQPFFRPPLPPLPSRPRPIFALLLLKRPHFTI